MRASYLRLCWFYEMSGTCQADCVDRREEKARISLLVKPANLGSSSAFQSTRRDFAFRSNRSGSRYDRKIIVEEGLEMREIECAVIAMTDPKQAPGE